jgi:hypothetical protein
MRYSRLAFATLLTASCQQQQAEVGVSSFSEASEDKLQYGGNGMGNGANGMGNGSNGMGNGSNGMGNGSNGMPNGSNGVRNGDNGYIGDALFLGKLLTDPTLSQALTSFALTTSTLSYDVKFYLRQAIRLNRGLPLECSPGVYSQTTQTPMGPMTLSCSLNYDVDALLADLKVFDYMTRGALGETQSITLPFEGSMTAPLTTNLASFRGNFGLCETTWAVTGELDNVCGQRLSAYFGAVNQPLGLKNFVMMRPAGANSMHTVAQGYGKTGVVSRPGPTTWTPAPFVNSFHYLYGVENGYTDTSPQNGWDDSDESRVKSFLDCSSATSSGVEGNCGWRAGYIFRCTQGESVRVNLCAANSTLDSVVRVCQGTNGCDSTSRVLSDGVTGTTSTTAGLARVVVANDDSNGAAARCSTTPTFTCGAGYSSPVAGKKYLYNFMMTTYNRAATTDQTTLYNNVTSNRVAVQKANGTSWTTVPAATEDQIFTQWEGAFYGNIFKRESSTGKMRSLTLGAMCEQRLSAPPANYCLQANPNANVFRRDWCVPDRVYNSSNQVIATPINRNLLEDGRITEAFFTTRSNCVPCENYFGTGVNTDGTSANRTSFLNDHSSVTLADIRANFDYGSRYYPMQYSCESGSFDPIQDWGSFLRYCASKESYQDAACLATTPDATLGLCVSPNVTCTAKTTSTYDRSGSYYLTFQGAQEDSASSYQHGLEVWLPKHVQ